MDLHSPQIQGFFSVPVDNLRAGPVLANYLQNLELEDLTVVSPDAGGVGRARVFAKRVSAELAIIDKRRPAPNVAKVLRVIGEVKVEKIENSELEKLILTNTIPLREKTKSSQKFKSLSVAPLFGEAIRRINKGYSVSSLFV